MVKLLLDAGAQLDIRDNVSTEPSTYMYMGASHDLHGGRSIVAIIAYYMN